MSPENPHRLAGLDKQRLIIFEIPERVDDRMIAFPISRRFAGPTIDDKVLRTLADLRVEIVHQHPQRRFLQPPLHEMAVPRGALIALRSKPAGCGISMSLLVLPELAFVNPWRAV